MATELRCPVLPSGRFGTTVQNQAGQKRRPEEGWGSSHYLVGSGPESSFVGILATVGPYEINNLHALSAGRRFESRCPSNHRYR